MILVHLHELSAVKILFPDSDALVTLFFPFALIDDGSSTCCCWANGERAATLLRLHEELPLRAFVSSGCTLQCVGVDKSFTKSTMFHLERILRKNSRITVRNHGSIVDSSYQDLTVSVSSENALSTSDENLLKFIVFNSCFGTFWVSIYSKRKIFI